MQRSHTALFFACLVLALSANALARTARPKSYVDTRTRNIDSGRKVLVVIPQFSIGANYEIFTMGPLVGMAEALVDQKLNEIRAGDARRLVAPLVSALGHYDFDGSLYAGLMPTIKASPWLRGQDLELTHAGDADSIERELNESNTRQMLVLRGTYYVDFHQQRIVVELQASMLIRKIPKGQHSKVRLELDYIPYLQVFSSISCLPHG